MAALQGTAPPGSPYWLELIKHQGKSSYNPNPDTYQVFRNVKDFGAVGDGVADDSVAINLAISSGDRCGGGGACRSSTITPAVVYFPSGIYRVSKSIIPYYYTQLVGDAKNPPTLLADPTFNDIAVIDVNPYMAGGAQWFDNQNTFLRSIRNFVIDVRQVPFDKAQGTGIHWQVAQATSLTNVVVEMSTQPGTAHQGVWMENGSGGFMSDLIFNGGRFGMWVGNQQFTVRNVTVNGANTGIFAVWNWGWTFQGVTLNNCTEVGFDITTGNSVAAEAITDAVVTNTPIFVQRSTSSDGSLDGSIILNNVKLTNVPVAVGVAGGEVLLPGSASSINIPSWTQGNVYSGTSGTGSFIQGTLTPTPSIASVLLDGEGRVFGKSRPQYADFAVDQFVSVKDHGAIGDGVIDDTEAIQTILDQNAGQKIIFFDAGTYIVTSTIILPPETRIVGEAWATIAGAGGFFQDLYDPQVVVRVGEEGQQGVAEISDIIFTTIGPAAGAIVVEWNMKHPEGNKGGCGLWDSHIRLGGAEGSNLQNATCPESAPVDPPNPACFAAFLALHLTPQSTAYLEGTWVWLADHDLDVIGDPRITIFAGRGVLSESQGPVWMIGTASEHFVSYQYNLVGARNHYLGLMQTESPYFQPSPPAPTPYPINPTYKDPSFPTEGLVTAWALTVKSSDNIFVFGAGFYSFFDNYNQLCLDSRDCQSHIVDISSDSTNIYLYSLGTVASTWQISVDTSGVVDQSQNINGFASTVTFWRLD